MSAGNESTALIVAQPQMVPVRLIVVMDDSGRWAASGAGTCSTSDSVSNAMSGLGRYVGDNLGPLSVHEVEVMVPRPNSDLRGIVMGSVEAAP